MLEEDAPFYENSRVPFDACCSANRIELKNLAATVKALFRHPACVVSADGSDTGEMVANLKLAYRHLEDAVMRLGKAIQAFEGGKSVYDDRDRARLK